VFVDCRITGELGGRSSAPSYVRISPHFEEVLEVQMISDLGFDVVSLEFVAPCLRENNDDDRSRP
jgi:hypothetical protein